MKFLILSLILMSTAFEARASGCGGVGTLATGREEIKESVKINFSFAASQADCHPHPSSPRYTQCTIKVPPSPLPFSDVFLGLTPEAMMAQFASMEGREVEVQKVNIEWEEYDDCSGESKIWWSGYYRLNAGMAKPMFAPGPYSSHGLPPF